MLLFWISFVLAFLPIRIISPFKVFGKKNIKEQKNFIIASNHRSNFDAILLDYTFVRRVRYLAKKELFKSNFFRFWLKNVFGAISIDREKGITPSQYREINKVLNKKQTLGIFPQGTRDENMSVKGGVCYFAIKYKRPILPCFIVDKQRFMKTNHVLIGKPFELSQFYDMKLDKDTLERAEKIVLNKINNLKIDFEKQQSEKNLVKQLKKQKK